MSEKIDKQKSADQGADATPAQAWYREQAEAFGDWTVYYLRLLLGGQSAAAEVMRNARYAGHFGNLALAVSPQGWEAFADWLRVEAAHAFREADRRLGSNDADVWIGYRNAILAVQGKLKAALPSPPRVAAGPEEPT